VLWWVSDEPGGVVVAQTREVGHHQRSPVVVPGLRDVLWPSTVTPQHRIHQDEEILDRLRVRRLLDCEGDVVGRNRLDRRA
jgi:hypothetical protein